MAIFFADLEEALLMSQLKTIKRASTLGIRTNRKDSRYKKNTVKREIFLIFYYFATTKTFKIVYKTEKQ